jgi:hypothetical protein
MARQRIQPALCDQLWPDQGAMRPRNLLLIYHFKIQQLVADWISRHAADLFADFLVGPGPFADQAMIAN